LSSTSFSGRLLLSQRSSSRSKQGDQSKQEDQNRRNYDDPKRDDQKRAAVPHHQITGREYVHPLLRQAQLDALQRQQESLRQELADYEALKGSGLRVFPAASFDELPRTLIKARIAAGLSQKELAERLGLKEQQVQKYEATEYTSASMARMRDVIQALGVTVMEEVALTR